MEQYELRIFEMPRIIKEVDQLWDRLQSDETLREDAADAQIDLRVLAGLKREGVFIFKSAGHGIDGAALMNFSLAPALLPAVAVVAYDLWKRVLLPRLEQQFGKDAIKRKASGAESGTATRKRSATRNGEVGRNKAVAKKTNASKSKRAGAKKKAKHR